MPMIVSQVARTYRSNALWHSNEETWKRRGGDLPDLPKYTIEPAALLPGLPISGWSAFDTFALEATHGLAAVLNAVVRFKQAVRKLQSHSEVSAVDRRIVTTSDPSVLSAAALPGAALGAYRIEVERIASAPYKEGTELESHAGTAIAVGSNQMRLTMGESSAPFSIYIIRTDTNMQALKKLQNAIHQTGLPVHASLMFNDEENLVRLRITGNSTGSGQSGFTITDVYGSAARVSGIEQESQAGADAAYRIDGGAAILSGSNQVALDEGKLTLHLRQSSTSQVEVNVIADEIHAKQELQQVSLRFNELHAAFSGASRYLNSDSVSQALGEAAALGLQLALSPKPPEELEEQEELLEPPLPSSDTPWSSIGLSQFADGTLCVDEEGLDKQLAASFDQWQSRLREPEGPISLLVRGLNRLLALSTEELLDRRKAAFQAFASYRFQPWGSLRTYLPLPLSGTLINRYF